MSTDVLLQPYRDIDIQIFVLDYEFNILDEISGIVESASFNIDGDSDIRRTADITMLLKSNYTNTGALNDIYFQAGNGYWFDKYLQIKIGVLDILAQEYKWYQQGVYLINEPSINYDATTNSLSFQAVDLMSKMTGLRNGYLEGQEYTILTTDSAGNPTGATVTENISSLLELQNFYQYVLFTPDQNVIPQDISISPGGTTYDLLSQLRDINSNWEMFFDINGTFYFQKIPSGEVTTSNGTVEYDKHPTPVIDDTTWDKLLISWDLSTDFESVKNYVEVYGRTYETDNSDAATNVALNGHALTATVDYNMGDSTDLTYHLVVINIPVPAQESDWRSISAIILSDSNSHEVTISCTPHMKYHSTDTRTVSCLVRTHYNDTTNTIEGEYIGYFQPEAVAWENNPSSPFYVGDVINIYPEVYDNTGTSTTGTRYNVGDRVYYPATIYDSTSTVYNTGDKCYYPTLQDSLYTCLEDNVSGTWDASKWSQSSTDNIYICISNNSYGAWDSTKWHLDNQFTPVFHKWNGTAQYYYDDMVYYNQALWCSVTDNRNIGQIPSENISTCWKKINRIDAIPGKLPLFKKMIRGVCVGDDYDNIATNNSVLECASYELYSRCRLHDTINITCVPIYDLDVNKIMSITLPNEGEPSYWIIKSISTSFEPTGTQSITATRYYPEYPIFGSNITYVTNLYPSETLYPSDTRFPG